MPENITRQSVDVNIRLNDDGTLKGLVMCQATTYIRKSTNGRVLESWKGPDGEEILIPADLIGNVIKEMVDWSAYVASGECARDTKAPVSWPNSVSTVEG